VDVNNLKKTAANISALSSTNGAGGILDIFYADWKLKVNENKKIVGIIQELWENSYCSPEVSYFWHCFGKICCRKTLMYIDRVCFRLPDALITTAGQSKKHKIQRSLTPHLDCCPHEITKSIDSGISPPSMHKWRPIQCFVALTDTVNANEGGFEACPGLHKRFSRWSNFRLPSLNRPTDPPPCVGSFTPIRPAEDRDVLRLMEHIPCRAGDLVCWDYRIPHSNARFNKKDEAREVLYLGFLPYVELNKCYAERQLSDYLRGKNPSDQWVHNKEDDDNTTQKNLYNFSSLGRKMMTMETWVD
jgi:hypothetical protein